jgi:hypothetical protein
MVPVEFLDGLGCYLLAVSADGNANWMNSYALSFMAP